MTPTIVAVLRRRRVLAALLGAASALVVYRTPDDLSAFALWGDELLRGHLSLVYDNSTDQGGPLQLILDVLLRSTAPDGAVLIPVLWCVGVLFARRGHYVRAVCSCLRSAIVLAPMQRQTLLLCYVAWASVSAGQSYAYVGALLVVVLVVVLVAAHAAHAAHAARRLSELLRASGRVPATSGAEGRTALDCGPTRPVVPS